MNVWEEGDEKVGMKTPRDVFLYELGLTRDLEQAGDEMLSAIARRIHNEDLARLMHEQEESRNRHLADFDSCTTAFGARPLQTSSPMVGALRDRFQASLALDPSAEALDLFVLGTVLRFMYLTIASYSELIDLAGLMGERECERMFRAIATDNQEHLAKIQKQGYEMTQAIMAFA